MRESILFATVNGNYVYFECPSPIDQDEGMTVLLIHGARANHEARSPQLEYLSGQHTPIAVDLLWHRASERPGSSVYQCTLTS